MSSAHVLAAIPLASGREYVIGRNPDSGVAVDDASISRRHALLNTVGELTLEDLGSTNGTRVRGVQLRPGERVQLDVGVVFELGNATFLVQRALVADVATALATGPEKTSRAASGRAPTLAPTAAVLRAPQMQRLYEMLDIVAPSGLNVVILGETGVGKELLAESVHRRSSRAEKPFLRLNCAALPESVLEGELFGYEKGAFTGAVQARPGLFESADGGTVFLDEIGEMPLSVQAKILRLLESGEVLRLGSRQTTVVDVRFIAATHRDLRFLITSGAFRADLYFRLNGISLVVPPLRERIEDLGELAERLLAASAAKTGRRAPGLAPDAIALLEGYGWPGNVRELRNIMERALAFSRSEQLTARDLIRAAPELEEAKDASVVKPRDTTGRMAPIDLFPVAPATSPTIPTLKVAEEQSEPADDAADLRSQRRWFEKQRILATLAKTAGNQKRAADLLGVSRRTLVTKLEEYAIERPRKQ